MQYVCLSTAWWSNLARIQLKSSVQWTQSFISYPFVIPGQFTSNDVNKFKTIVIFDCRGVEPVDFEPKSGWIAEAEDNGKTFFYTIELWDSNADSTINEDLLKEKIMSEKLNQPSSDLVRIAIYWFNFILNIKLQIKNCSGHYPLVKYPNFVLTETNIYFYWGPYS